MPAAATETATASAASFWANHDPLEEGEAAKEENFLF